VLRFWDNDVLLHAEDVMQAIYNALHSTPHPNPLPVHTGRGDH
jgi:very-short-patch-repair endonuclease